MDAEIIHAADAIAPIVVTTAKRIRPSAELNAARMRLRHNG
jgi:hypothetical protein